MDKLPFPLPPLPSADLLLQLGARLPPPAWLRAELHNRLVLLLNHVLQQEPQAVERLRRQQGKRLELHWGRVEFVLTPTPAGLLALAAGADTAADLRLRVPETSPLTIARQLLAGDKPPVEIQGDVQLAAEIAWLADNLRWDFEEDLARLFGDAFAHRLAEAARRLAQALRGFLSRLAPARGTAA
jgi:ubiquinone biosynthesis protein UbiJ